MLNDLLHKAQPEQVEEVFTEETVDEVAQANTDYNFADGNLASSEQLDAFLQEFNQEKEEKDCPLEPTPEDLEEEPDPENEEAISNETARNTAEFIVTTIDEGASAGLAYLSKDPQDNFRAGRDQKKNLANLFTKFCKEKGTEIPLGLQITICLVTVYASKIPYALDRRHLNEEREQIERERQYILEARQQLEEDKAKVEEERKIVRQLRTEAENSK